jgi:hypothetical protein
MSADGKIADYRRSPARFGSNRDRHHLEQLISQMDAVLLGGNTLRAYGSSLLIIPTRIQQYVTERVYLHYVLLGKEAGPLAERMVDSVTGAWESLLVRRVWFGSASLACQALPCSSISVSSVPSVVNSSASELFVFVANPEK